MVGDDFPRSNTYLLPCALHPPAAEDLSEMGGFAWFLTSSVLCSMDCSTPTSSVLVGRSRKFVALW